MLDREHLGLLDVSARRNAFGRQVQSFEADLELGGRTVRAVFIRAPWVDEHGDGVEVLAEGRRPPGRGQAGQHHGCGLSSRAERRAEPAPLAGGERERKGSNLRDPRVEALAAILVRYSTQVEKGDVCVIQASTAAEPLVLSVYEEVLKAGGLPILQLSPAGAPALFFDLASDDQLDWVPPTRQLDG